MALARLQREKEAEEKKKRELKFTIIKAGDAIYFPKKFDSIAMHYIGYLADGTMFDNSYNRGQPVYFILGGGHVIQGWEQVIPMVSKALYLSFFSSLLLHSKFDTVICGNRYCIEHLLLHGISVISILHMYSIVLLIIVTLPFILHFIFCSCRKEKRLVSLSLRI
jgi:hypothetical protein